MVRDSSSHCRGDELPLSVSLPLHWLWASLPQTSVGMAAVVKVPVESQLIFQGLSLFGEGQGQASEATVFLLRFCLSA
jgi:hypothetical protein